MHAQASAKESLPSKAFAKLKVVQNTDNLWVSANVEIRAIVWRRLQVRKRINYPKSLLNRINKGFLRTIIVIATFAALFYFFHFNKNFNNFPTILKIRDKELNIEIADSFDERQFGLSGRDYLDDNKGLFFVFDRDDFYGIWMKDMKFSIDIIWIDSGGKIVSIKTNILPATYPESFTSEKPAKYVLEVNAGWADKNSIKIGDMVELR